ncbi:hypothetical protein TSUD_16480 [Trifolium subterraneum]|uniref:RNase H type-1 domain-containing protein n=1 Tax=Trifolium subterraneum TaxID=3900 RepID=A0A2Z6NCN5_TRISU|nr:hypothetical protein TSUD_16480 [Trifolium subterraneum]
MNLCRHNDGKVAGKAATMLWVLWKNRNNWIWNHEKDNRQQLGRLEMNLWHEWEAVQVANSSGGQQVQQVPSAWQPPPQGKFNCNVDAGIHEAAKKTSAGWCVRDYRGRFVLGGSSWIHGKCSTNEGEALALLEAMKEM